MGSVICSYECPNCGNDNAFEEYYYKSNEIYRFCERCGYFFQHYMVYDEATKKPKLLDPTEPESWNNYVFNTKECINPYGSIIIQHEKYAEISSIGSKDEFDDVFSLFKTNDISKFKSITLNRVIHGEEVIIDVLKMIKDEIQEG